MKREPTTFLAELTYADSTNLLPFLRIIPTF